MRNRFDGQLMQLNSELLKMGALCEEAISYAVKCLTESSIEMKNNALEAERLIDRKERDIETSWKWRKSSKSTRTGSC